MPKVFSPTASGSFVSKTPLPLTSTAVPSMKTWFPGSVRPRTGIWTVGYWSPPPEAVGCISLIRSSRLPISTLTSVVGSRIVRLGRLTVVAARPPSSVLMPTYTRPWSFRGSTTVRNDPSASVGTVWPLTITCCSPDAAVEA